MTSAEEGNLKSAEMIAELCVGALTAVRAYVHAEVKNRHDAEDVMQEISRAVMASTGRYDASRPLVNWVFGIARNHVLQYHRQRSKDRAVFSSELVESLAIAYGELLPSLPARREALQECLKRLRGNQRQIINMYYQDDVPQSEIARQLEMSKSAVGVLMHRARTALKDCIDRRLSKESG